MIKSVNRAIKKYSEAGLHAIKFSGLQYRMRYAAMAARFRSPTWSDGAYVFRAGDWMIPGGLMIYSAIVQRIAVIIRP
jgi:hypothetical protein